MVDIIWTNHLRERSWQRGIDPTLVEKTIRFPDKVVNSSTTNSKKHIKTINGRQIVAAVKHQGNSWIVTSVWAKSEDDRNSPYHKSLLERLIYSLVLRFENYLRRRLKL